MDQERLLREAILEDPSDHLAYLALADWYEEQGWAEVAAHTRQGDALPTLFEWGAGRGGGWGSYVEDAPGLPCYTQGLIRRLMFGVPCRLGCGGFLRRGVVEAVSLPLRDFLEGAELLFLSQPVRGVFITDRRPRHRADGWGYGLYPDPDAGDQSHVLPRELYLEYMRSSTKRRGHPREEDAVLSLSEGCVAYGLGLRRERLAAAPSA